MIKDRSYPHKFRELCLNLLVNQKVYTSLIVYWTLQWTHKSFSLVSTKFNLLQDSIHSEAKEAKLTRFFLLKSFEVLIYNRVTASKIPVPDPMAPMKSAKTVSAPMQTPPKAAAVGIYRFSSFCKLDSVSRHHHLLFLVIFYISSKWVPRPGQCSKLLISGADF